MKSSTLLLIIVTLLLAGGVYWYFSISGGTQPSLTITPGSQSSTQAKFAALVGQLQPITFATAIFSDPRFTALVDITTPIESETLGRTDPFAPPSQGGQPPASSLGTK